MRRGFPPLLAGLFTVVIGVGGGCVERTLTIQSEPPGALVYMNGQEAGRTPMQRDFTWYGKYDVQIRKDGYETVDTVTNVKAPLWQWVPFDLFAELLPIPFEDHQQFSYTLTPTTPELVDAQDMLTRAAQMKTELRSGRLTRPAATQPATTQPAP